MKSSFYAFIFSLLFVACKSENADLVVYNAVVYTVNDSFDVASSFAVKNGKFIAIGGDEISKRFNAKSTLDLKGLPVYPGFIDAHCHFYKLGITASQAALRGLESEQQMIDRVISFAKQSDQVVIRGRGWDQNLWEPAEFPTKTLLDKAFPDQMVVLERVDGHALLVNQKVLDAAGINSTTRVEGGEVVLKNGKPSGVLIDNAQDLAIAALPQLSRKAQIEALIKAEQIALKNGLTTVDDAGLDRNVLELIDSLHKAEKLKIRVYGMIANHPDNLAYYLDKGMIQTDRLNIRSVKVYADGALGSRGAALKEPYTDEPTNRGLFLTPIATIDSLAIKLAEKGFQMNTHAIGDAANEAVLKAYDAALAKIEDPRWRVEHAQVVAVEDLPYFDKKVIPSVQPTHATSDMEWADERLGHQRIETAYTFKDLLDWSGKIALGTDFPVEKVNPLHTFYAAVARKSIDGTPEGGYQMQNALSRSEALKGMTLWAAFANFEENQKGSIEEGKVADFVILTKDIMTIQESRIPKVEVVATILNGELVYQRKQ